MVIQVGDIVEAIQGAPYMVTSVGTQWVVYESPFVNQDGELSIVVGDIPESVSEFQARKKKYLPYHQKKGLSSFSYASKKMHAFQTYTISPEYFKVLRKMGTNKEYVHLLSQGDAWEEEKQESDWQRVSREFTLTIDDEDLPF